MRSNFSIAHSALLLQLLEERAIQSNAVTPQHMTGIMEPLITALNELRTMRIAPAPDLPMEVVPAPVAHRMHVWGGSGHLLPENFVISAVNVSLAWQIWCCGNASLQAPALRLVHASDFSLPVERKKFSQFKFLMKDMERLVLTRDPTVDFSSITIQQALDLFQEHLSDLASIETPTKRKSRVGELAWRTVANQRRSQVQSPLIEH